MKPLGNRLFFWLSVLLFLGFDASVGNYVFGRYQIAVEALGLLITALVFFFLLISQANNPQKPLSAQDKYKLAVLIHERAANHKLKLKDFLRKIFKWRGK